MIFGMLSLEFGGTKVIKMVSANQPVSDVLFSCLFIDFFFESSLPITSTIVYALKSFLNFLLEKERLKF